MSSQTRHTPIQESSSPEIPVSPERDFTKVPNSLRREAVPAGLFKGKSKQLYDALYGMTRGAVVAKRKVRISRPRLMKLAHIGARVTFDTNVDHLCSVGLVSVRVLTGEHEGNEYEVFIPEEISMASQTSQTSQTSHALNVDRLVRLESSQTRHTLSATVSGTYAETNTSFKTKDEKLDDEAFAGLLAVERELTGRNSPPEKWAELVDVLVTELKIAAGRTTVSSVPAFLAEHLRRRLFKKDQKQLTSEADTEIAAVTTDQKVDAALCPDCFGTGMYYPEGYDKGVAKCRHEKLMVSATPTASGTPASAPAAQPPTDGDLVEMAVGFLHQGMDIEAVGQLLAASINPEHWPRVRAAALERFERERSQMRPPKQS